MRKINVAVLVSGGGTNLQALIDYMKKHKSYTIDLVISSSNDAYAITRAMNNNIDYCIVDRKLCDNQKDFENQIIKNLEEYKIDIIVLAGFMCILSKTLVDKYNNRIINVHPSLIPSFCGKGFYGLKVHEEALKYGVKVTGATVHYVNEIPDGGQIIMQKAVNINKNDTPSILQKRVMEKAEWVILPKSLEKVYNKYKELEYEKNNR